MSSLQEKILLLGHHYQNVKFVENGAEIIVKLEDAMFSLASPALSLLLPKSKDFEIRALQKGTVELRLFFEREELEKIVGDK